MKKVTLKEVLSMEQIKKGIVDNLCINEKAIMDTINTGKNNVSIIVNINGESYDFENTLHVDDEKKVFLLESRLFKKADGSMVNAYVELLDENLNIIEEYVDDVWSYADFKVVT